MSLPVTLRVARRLVLLAGGGRVAARKARAVHEAGAKLRVVAPRIGDDLRSLLGEAGAETRLRNFSLEDLDGVFLAIAATDDDEVNKRIVSEARERGILTLDATDTERGDVAMPAVFRNGDLTVAVDTAGASPAFARRMLDELRERYGEQHAAALKTLRRLRKYAQDALPTGERAEVLRELADLPVDRLARMEVRTLLAATRASRLARTQTSWVAARLATHGIVTESSADHHDRRSFERSPAFRHCIAQHLR